MKLLRGIRNYFDLNQHLPPVDWSLVKEKTVLLGAGRVFSREGGKKAATKEFWEAEAKRLEENLNKASYEISVRDRKILALESRVNQLQRGGVSSEHKVTSEPNQGAQSTGLKIKTNRFSEGMKAREAILSASQFPPEIQEPQMRPRPVIVWWEQLLLYACIVFGTRKTDVRKSD
jgi:hypothetical protein